MTEKTNFIPAPAHIDPNIVFHCSAKIYSRHDMGARGYQENQLMIALPACMEDNARRRIVSILGANVLLDIKDGDMILVVTQTKEKAK